MTTTLQNQIVWYTRAQVGITCAMILAGVAFAVGWYQPATRQLERLNGRIAQQRQELEATGREADAVPELEDQVNKYKSRLSQNDKKIPKQLEFDSFIRDINNIYQQTGVKKIDWAPSGVQKIDPVFATPVSMKFEGDFMNVYQFLKEIEEMDRLTRVQSLEIHCQDSQFGRVDVKMVMNIYYAPEAK